MITLYKVTHKESGEFYIGQTRKTIGVNYWTSSNYVSFSRDTIDDWHIEILQQDEDREVIYKAEQIVIREHYDNPLNLNRNYTIEGSGNHYDGYWEDPAARARHSQVTQQQMSDPARRAHNAKMSRAQHRRNPQQKVKHGEKIKQLWRDPEFREKVREAKSQNKDRTSANGLIRAAKLREIKVSCIACRRELVWHASWKHWGSINCKKRQKK